VSPKQVFSSVLRTVSPRLWLAIHARRLANKPSDKEAWLLPLLTERDAAAIDVGANVGDYAWHLRSLCARVHAFEPNPALARWLRRSFGDSISVHDVALSNKAGTAELNIPLGDGGHEEAYATIEQRADLVAAAQGLGLAQVRVPVQRLDTLELPRIGFLKVDVEGHELAMLEGAEGLLRRDLPVLLVEAEERHRPRAVASVVAFLSGLGYRGFYLHEGRLHDIAGFDGARLQNPANVGPRGQKPGTIYINNFIFAARLETLQRLDGLLVAGSART
jgi:FkbM family methyltransferase